MLGSGFSPCQALFCASRRFTPYRLTAADYSNNDYYHYTYDAVGNRLTQANMVNGLSSTVSYVYDDANRLTSVNGVTYTWDNNGNLLNDGVNTYTYNAANQLKTLTGPSVNASYAYNGMGDRLQQVHNGQTTTFTMDLNTGLTQALSDGTNTYIYGNGRIAQINTGTEYFLGDALGSVRQLTNTSGAITYASAYDPYGVTTQTSGAAQTAYGFTGEYTSNDLVYLRARMYSPGMGRFLTRDTWAGDANSPMSFNRWMYVEGNPITYTDPSGQICLDPWAPSGFHLDPSRGCDYPVGSTGALWWRRDPLGPDTAVIDMPWVDEQSQQNWNRYPNSCGASALYMFLKAEGVSVNFDTLVQQLQNERPGGYNGYCCNNSVRDANGTYMLPTATPDPLGWCNEACVSGEALASVARKYYGLDIISGELDTSTSLSESEPGTLCINLNQVRVNHNVFWSFCCHQRLF
jgi:RHS repeat-associated protein